MLNMSDLTLNKHRCKLKDLCFKTATKPYTYRSGEDGLWRANLQDFQGWECLGLKSSSFCIQDVFVHSSNHDSITVANRIPGVTNSQDPIYSTMDGGLTWQTAIDGLENDNTGYYFSISRFMEREDGSILGTGVGTFRMDNFNDTWNKMDEGNELIVGDCTTFSFISHPLFQDIMWRGGSHFMFWTRFLECSLDGGVTWNSHVYSLPEGPNDFRITGIALDPIEPNIVYATCGFELYKSMDGGDSWSESIFNNIYDYSDYIRITSTDISGFLFASKDETVFRTLDGGETWEDLTPPIYKPVLDFFYDENNRQLFVGTYQGVYIFGLEG